MNKNFHKLLISLLLMPCMLCAAHRFKLALYDYDPTFNQTLAGILDGKTNIIYYYIVDGDPNWGKKNDVTEFIIWHVPIEWEPYDNFSKGRPSLFNITDRPDLDYPPGSPQNES